MTDALAAPPPILVEGLVKEFEDRHRGIVRAVNEVSFACHAGEVFGLLGPNGAGKTTTLRILSTMLKPSRGRALVAGHDVAADPTAARKAMGFLSAATGLYERSTARELLRFFGELFEMPRGTLEARIEELAGLLTMGEFLDAPCGKLSSGQRQKVSIARTILHDPQVIILDEPTANLDVLVAHDVLGFVESERERGKTVLLSTHVMSEVDRLCERVAIIHHGRVLALGERAELAARAGSASIEPYFFEVVEQAAAEGAAAHDPEGVA